MKTVKAPVRAFAALVIILADVTQAAGGQVYWELNSQSPNLQSNGQALPATMRFQLGVFTDGFVPAAANLAEWARHWRSWDELQYDLQTGAFSKELLFNENPPPFTEGAKLYCWGYFASSATSSEYFLATDSSWRIPSGTDPLAFPVFVDLETAAEVILGGAFPDSGTIQTAAVTTGEAPAFLFTDWRRSRFSAAAAKNDAISGPLADPDQDGRSNLLEYLTGSPPLAAGQPLVLDAAAGPDAAAGVLTIGFPSPPSARVNFEFESSSDLTDWMSGTTPAPVYDALQERWGIAPAITPATDRTFWRLRVISAVEP